MAPTLRKAKSQTKLAEPVAKSPKTEKRKATDDGSPVAVKKQRGPKAAKETKAKEAKEVKKVEEPKVEKPKAKKSILKKASKAAPQPEPEVAVVEEQALVVAQQSEEDGNEEWGPEDSDNDDEVVRDLVAAFESSDDEADPAPDALVLQPGQDLGKIPPVQLPAKKNKKRKQIDNGPAEEPGTVWISRLPHGFYEHQMRQYFEQFGEVTRLRLSRNRQTGASKHYAFIEFAEASVAEIVAKTMDNYLMYGHLLKCRVLSPEQIHPKLWVGANRRFKKIPWAHLEGKKLAKPQTESQWEGRITRESTRRAKRADKLKEIGYEYEAPELKKAIALPAVEALAIESGEGVKGLIEAAPAAVEVQTTVVVEEVQKSEPEPTAPAKKGKKKGPKATKKK